MSHLENFEMCNTSYLNSITKLTVQRACLNCREIHCLVCQFFVHVFPQSSMYMYVRQRSPVCGLEDRITFRTSVCHPWRVIEGWPCIERRTAFGQLRPFNFEDCCRRYNWREGMANMYVILLLLPLVFHASGNYLIKSLSLSLSLSLPLSLSLSGHIIFDYSYFVLYTHSTALYIFRGIGRTGV